jgi:hypothetical protein
MTTQEQPAIPPPQPFPQFQPPRPPAKPSFQRWWGGLPQAGRVGVIISGLVAAFVLMAIIGLIVNATEGHSASWQQGYDKGDVAAVHAVPSRVESLPGGATFSCRGNLMVAQYAGNSPASPDDFVAGCRAAFAKHGMRSW